MELRHLFLFLVFTAVLWFPYSSEAQYKSRGPEFDYEDAEYFFENENYYDAKNLFEELHKLYPQVIEYTFKLGICELHLGESTKRAIEYLEMTITEKSNFPNALYFLARAYALDYRFDKASEFLEKADLSNRTDDYLKKEIPHLLEQVKNCRELTRDTLDVEIINLGNKVNSINNEYSPTVNLDESTLIYTYRGVQSKGGRQDFSNKPDPRGLYYEDIFESTFENGEWTKPKPLSDKVNTNVNEASISLSHDGNNLFIYKDTEENSGEIYQTQKMDGSWSEASSLNINSPDWEGSAAISPDGKTLIFSSDRPGGLGGIDLYMADLADQGNWTNIRNMGTKINTPYDDDAPFIHADGMTFSFSSKGHNSMGGYDIFESQIWGDTTFSDARNIGYPINTSGNDVYFFVSGMGNAYYSSGREGGYGQQDIYFIDVRDVVSSKPVFEKIALDESNFLDLDSLNIDLVLDLYGDQSHEGLVFKVQVAAYKISENYSAAHLTDLGDIDKITLEDGITRFTIGEYQTLKEAKELQKQAIEKGQKDAFVIIFVDGKRSYLAELIEKGILK